MLHKQFRVPLDGLTPIAEEITIQKQAKKKETAEGPYLLRSAADDDTNSSGDEHNADADQEKIAPEGESEVKP